MKSLKSWMTAGFVALVFTLIFAQDALAQRRGASSGPMFAGDMSLGIGLSTVSAGQNDLNDVIDADVAANGASTKNLGSAWEFFAQWTYRYSRTNYALVLRPSYFMQEATGSSSAGSHDYKLNGYTIFPIFRLYALENSFIRFFMQAGLGYGALNGEISQGSQSLKFKGSAFGVMGGIGADFCFTDVHCMTVEGNLRYLPIERNVTSGGNCTSMAGITQCGGSSEVERNNKDLGTTMSGVQGAISYTMNF
jgi:hypothetical protein